VAATAFAAVAGFFHYVTAGPNKVQAEDDEEARHLLEHADTTPTDHLDKPR
jgi:formate dehydrogenase iron-sulfur subunit